MDHEKHFGNFTVGYGSQKTAGAGTLDKAVDAPDVPTKYDKKLIAKNILKASALSAFFIMRNKHKKH